MAKERGNDAIPSWSGYNYQGKITLLCSLNEINKIVATGLTESSFDGCYIEVEKTEDFVIFISEKVEALYQVKAYLSSDKISSFLLSNKNTPPDNRQPASSDITSPSITAAQAVARPLCIKILYKQ